ncbi:MAG: tyrosine-protein phosphatase [Clostridia bacterium]|nr:tyrosine-protein phosphatase [Clostridia bacterium]
MIRLIFPEDGAQISVLSPAHREYIRRHMSGSLDRGEFDESVTDFIAQPQNEIFIAARTNLTYPSAVFFRWSCDDPVRVNDIRVSENPDMSGPETVTIGRIFPVAGEGDGSVFCCAVTNFKTGRDYFWQVVTEDGGKSEIRRLFVAPDVLRPIYLSGGSNVRDLGGWMTKHGRRVRQGLLYRGVEIESVEGEKDHNLTDEGRAALAHELAVRTDLDLREESLDGDVRHGEWFGIRHIVAPLDTWCGILEEDGSARLKAVFDVLLDFENYPIYFHCYAGADRTGTLAAFLLFLLGVSYSDVKLDFGITTLSTCDHRNWELHGYRERFLALLRERYPGAADHAELMESHLLSLGIEKDQIRKLKEFLLE